MNKKFEVCSAIEPIDRIENSMGGLSMNSLTHSLIIEIMANKSILG
jgi:hypothetical protein